jgi:rfaE bifunctional protein nucleotidyltransferase chain/domain
MKTRLVSARRAVDLIKKLQHRGKKVVFTNGCFDIVHAGHAIYLDRARKLGDFLVVGLNSDVSVQRLKGKGRPIMPFKERAILLSYLTPVDLVVGFKESTPAKLIGLLHPDILVKGSDYKVSEIVGAQEIKAWGGIVRRIPLVRGKSSSRIISRLRALKR